MGLIVDEQCRLLCQLPGVPPRRCEFICKTRWGMDIEANLAFDRILPPPSGFQKVGLFTFLSLGQLPPTTRVRVDDVEVVTPLNRSLPASALATRIRRGVAEEGGRVIAVSVLRRRERRMVPKSWQVPGLVANNPVWRRVFGSRDTFAIPFASELATVDVWRVRVLHDPIGVGVGIAVILIAIGAILLLDYFSTRSLSTTESTVSNLIDRVGEAGSDIISAPFQGATNTLLLFIVAGGAITLGFILVARQAGVETGTFIPPALPAPQAGITVGPPAARLEAGIRPGGRAPARRR